MALDGARHNAAEAITARPTDRCGECGRPYVNGGCFFHPPGWEAIESVKALYRAALAAHGALDDADRAKVRAWLDDVTLT